VLPLVSLSLEFFSLPFIRVMSIRWGINYLFNIAKPIWVMNCCIMLSLNCSFVWCTCLNYLNLYLWFVWIWIQKRGENKRKMIGKFKLKEKEKQPKPLPCSAFHPCGPDTPVPSLSSGPARQRHVRLAPRAHRSFSLSPPPPRLRLASALGPSRSPARWPMHRGRPILLSLPSGASWKGIRLTPIS
jgi:hypothetical protein